jgi:hypothetical protein
MRKQSIFNSAAVALYPLVILGLATTTGLLDWIDSLAFEEAQYSYFGQLLAKYAWIALGLPILIILATYLYFAFSNPQLAFWKRVLWSATLLFAMPFAVLLYWWFYKRESA